MNLLKKIFSFAVILLFMVGCSDEPENPASGSVIEEVDGETFSVFNLSSTADAEITGTHEVTFHISTPNLENEFSFPGTITEESNLSGAAKTLLLRCRLRLKDFDVPNGDYFLSISGEGLPALGAFKVQVLNQTITAVKRSAYQYKGLKGEGTQNNPYQIGTADEFEKFISLLYSDPDHGYGVYFVQTADISLEEKTDGVVGVAPFQGTYDGKSHKLDGIQWRERSSKFEGSEDRNIGLFTTLCNATISNLSLTEARLSYINGTGGCLAGIAKGTNTLENIHVEVALSVNGDYAGGLIGYVKGSMTASGITVANSSYISGQNFTGGLFGLFESTGASSLKDVNCSVFVRGHSFTGGLFGRALFDGSFSVDNIAGDGRIDIDGTNYVGGLFGYLEKAEVNLSNVTMGESTSIEVIGTECVGGIAGTIVSSTLSGSQVFDFAANSSGVMEIPVPSSFKSSYKGTVHGYKKVGGLVGDAYNSKILHLSSSATIDASGENVGGIVGYFEDVSNVSLIEDCVFNGSIIPSFNRNLGGIVGHFHSTNGGRMQDCVNYSSLVGGDGTGGICGYLYKEHNTDKSAKNLVQVNWAVNAGKVEGKGNVGGIIGEDYLLDNNRQYSNILNYEIDINSCMNAANVTAFGGNSEEALGGIAGRTGALTQVYACANHGTIEVQGKLHATGGIVGRAGRNYGNEEHEFYNTKVIECINTGTLNSTDKSARIGGIVGYAEEDQRKISGIWSCRNSGTITANQNDDTGGILGCTDLNSVLSGCFNNGRVEHGNAIVGTHKTFASVYWVDPKCYYLEGTGKSWPSDHTFSIPQSQIGDESKYEGYDFTTIWEITPDGPNLRRNKWRNPASAVIPK